MLEYTKISKEKEWYFISNKKTGAVSKFSKEELLMFFLYDKEIDNGLINFLSELKVPKKLIEIQVKNFKDKLEKDGWFRNKRPDNRGELMESVYLNITTDCNFKCPYCYQGNEKNKKQYEHK
jgi:sulfatase maturation enzyme AslB (radical SAM superfamily)